MPWNTFHIWNSRRNRNSSNQIATKSNAIFHSKTNGRKACRLKVVLLTPRHSRFKVGFLLQIAIVITDGQQTTDRGPFVPLSEASRGLKDKNVELFALGIGSGVDQGQLREVASSSNNVFTAKGFEGLKPVAKTIVQSACPGMWDIIVEFTSSHRMVGRLAYVMRHVNRVIKHEPRIEMSQ